MYQKIKGTDFLVVRFFDECGDGKVWTSGGLFDPCELEKPESVHKPVLYCGGAAVTLPYDWHDKVVSFYYNTDACAYTGRLKDIAWDAAVRANKNFERDANVYIADNGKAYPRIVFEN